MKAAKVIGIALAMLYGAVFVGQAGLDLAMCIDEVAIYGIRHAKCD